MWTAKRGGLLIVFRLTSIFFFFEAKIFYSWTKDFDFSGKNDHSSLSTSLLFRKK